MTFFNADVKYKDGRQDFIEDAISIKYIATEETGVFIKIERINGGDSFIALDSVEKIAMHHISKKNVLAYL